jgi:predicted transposase/invertase (TIGR01784 family)
MGNHSFLNDLVFKIVFSSEQNRHLLRALLNAILGLIGQDRIVDLTILNPHLDLEYAAEKRSILDVKARDGRGRLYNVEVQVCERPSYVERAVFYLARLFGGQLEKGDSYGQIVKTIGISIVDFILFEDLEPLHSRYRLYDAGNQRELTDILEIHFIELPRFDGLKPHSLRTPFEKWLHVLKFGEIYESGEHPLPDSLKEEEGIEMAIEAFRAAWSSDDVREMVEARKKALWDEATLIAHATQKGKLEVARNMLDSGMDRATVLRLSGLQPEDLP